MDQPNIHQFEITETQELLTMGEIQSLLYDYCDDFDENLTKAREEAREDNGSSEYRLPGRNLDDRLRETDIPNMTVEVSVSDHFQLVPGILTPSPPLPPPPTYGDILKVYRKHCAVYVRLQLEETLTVGEQEDIMLLWSSSFNLIPVLEAATESEFRKYIGFGLAARLALAESVTTEDITHVQFYLDQASIRATSALLRPNRKKILHSMVSSVLSGVPDLIFSENLCSISLTGSAMAETLDVLSPIFTGKEWKNKGSTDSRKLFLQVQTDRLALEDTDLPFEIDSSAEEVTEASIYNYLLENWGALPFLIGVHVKECHRDSKSSTFEVVFGHRVLPRLLVHSTANRPTRFSSTKYLPWPIFGWQL